MTTFDAPSREICQVKRARTNTPLQALELLNDVTYVEAARHLAQLMLTEGGRAPANGSPSASAGRRPEARRRRNSSAPGRGLERYRKSFEADPARAQRSGSQHGDSPATPGLDPSELAAYTATASVILNLDETITRE